jgi:hypothetical protein
MDQASRKNWIARGLIGLVLFLNVDCAVLFLKSPGLFAPGFEMPGAVGEAMVRGMGVLFLMWNVPYVVAAWNPTRYRISLWQAVVMQAIGLAGESYIFLNLPVEHTIARASILRFILFDGGGLVALLIAGMMLLRNRD